MTAFEIIQILTKGLVPLDRCGVSEFKTSDLSELSNLFGRHYIWSGHMFKGAVFYVYHESNDDDWFVDDADLVGTYFYDNSCSVHVFQVREFK